MTLLNISDEVSLLTIKVCGYEHSDPKTVDDASWLRCNIFAQTQGFFGQISASLRICEFALFLDDLRKCVAGQAHLAVFESAEDWLAIQVEFSEYGRARMRCALADRSGSFPSMSFRLEIGTGAVGQLIAGTAEVLREFGERKIKQ